MNPLILVTVGTDHHAFNRLVDWLAGWQAGRPAGRPADCHLQHGTSRPLEGAHCYASLPHGALEDLLARASCVVTHAGPGCVMEARHHGHVPIVVPRERRWGEHVDDHQLAFARSAAAAGLIWMARDAAHFSRLIDAALAGDPAFRGTAGPLIDLATVERFGTLVAELDPALALRSLAQVR